MGKFSTIFLKDFLDIESHADLVNLQEEAKQTDSRSVR